MRAIPCLAVLLALALAHLPAQAQVDDLLRLTDQLDRADKRDLERAVERAEGCTRVRDFACAEAQLNEARKRIADDKGRVAVKQAQDRLLAERRQAEADALLLARLAREREAEEALRQEARQREFEERLAARAADAEANRANSLALVTNALGQALQNQSAARAADQLRAQRFNQMQADVAANLARDQQRFAQERAQMESQRAAAQQRQANERQRAQVLQQQQLEAARRQQDLDVARQAAAQSARLLAANNPVAPAATTAAAPVAGNAGTGATAAAPATPARPRTDPELPKVHTWQWDDYQLNENTAQDWCERKTQMVRDSFKSSANELISIDTCSCTRSDAMAPLQPTYGCKFKYVWRQNVPDISSR